MAGESKPNWMLDLAPPTGPPLAKLLGALAAMVTELLRAWSVLEPLRLEVPRATAGTAGVTAGLPFTGDDEAPFAFCAEADEEEAPGWGPEATIGA